MIHRDIDRSPSVRKTKIQYGDTIQRSEYTDGVLRNNNRADNRLTNQMKLYDRAQKVILKQMGKESQLLRNKMATTNSASPRLTKLSPSEVKYNPFMVYGTKSQKFDPKATNLRPVNPVVAQKYENHIPTPRGGLNRKNGLSPINGTKSDESKKSSVGTSRSARKTDNSDKITFAKNKSGSLWNDSNGRDSGFQTGSSMSDHRVSRIQTGSAMSERKGDMSVLSNVVTENRSRLNHSARSGVSFIEILKEAEERRAKQESQMKERNEKSMQNTNVEPDRDGDQPLRPRTPNPQSNYDDKLSKARLPEPKQFEQQKHNKLSATPNETTYSEIK